MTELFGHVNAEQQLKKAFDQGRMHHALLLTGPDGVGKQALAYRFINYAITHPFGRSGQKDMRSDTHTERGHPNVFVVSPVYDEKKQRFKRDITLDALKGMVKFLRLAPQDDAPRFIIIKPADGMNIQTQNALLKMLEEPPVRTHFLLLTAQPGSMLATIRSRCLSINLNPLNSEDFTRGIHALLPHLDAQVIPELYRLSGGSLGQAIDSEKIDLRGLYGRLCASVIQWHDDKDSLPAMRLAEELARPGQEDISRKIVETLLDRVATAISAFTQQGVCGPVVPTEERILSIWQDFGVPRLLDMRENASKAWQSGEGGYLDKKIVLLRLISIASGMDS